MINRRTLEPKSESLLYPAFEYMQSRKWNNIHYNSELEVLSVPLSGQHGNFTVLVRAYSAMGILSSTTLLPFNVPAPHRKEIAELLCRLNWQSFLGCMEMDFRDGELACRTEVDFEGGTPTPTMIGNLIQASFVRLDKAFPMIMEVIYGNRSAEELFEPKLEYDALED